MYLAHSAIYIKIKAVNNILFYCYIYTLRDHKKTEHVPL